MEVIIRQATKEDEAFLWEMLYEAIYVPDGEDKFDKSLLKTSKLANYVENWGRDGDYGLIALNEQNQKIGAVWIRLFNELTRTYGYVDEQTPILSMALLPEYRGIGIGTKLMKEIIALAKEKQFPAISLSVAPENSALSLYEKFGFIKIGIDGTSWDMIAKLEPK
ncbi:hypothetical protein CHH83_11645 [Bacillus sp. 7586-K]|uniref:Ribosomal protein S18 acetylase RimI-like enzyme n=1 Tax=Metabacillus niabensis TaxID=324854 RepID=A0ABT9Z2M0_9BACI|nr:GNAT family N-acetyltransferase [Metabacillus niabensis]MDQ0226496.1 ribosomal protein S18 acetylase RimI-like enzyme [Metabacillus niabensis]PAD68845.1 hypothetical protein CHH83_11645 [Bacillus sp. 7586-K]